MKKQDLQELLTPEFLSTLHTAVECCNWDVDMIETMKFCDWCYNMAGQPKPQTLKDIISEWIDIYNIRSDSVKDRIAANLLERIETKWLPDEIALDGLTGDAHYSWGWNDCLKVIGNRLR